MRGQLLVHGWVVGRTWVLATYLAEDEGFGDMDCGEDAEDYGHGDRRSELWLDIVVRVTGIERNVSIRAWFCCCAGWSRL